MAWGLPAIFSLTRLLLMGRGFGIRFLRIAWLGILFSSLILFLRRSCFCRRWRRGCLATGKKGRCAAARCGFYLMCRRREFGGLRGGLDFRFMRGFFWLSRRCWLGFFFCRWWGIVGLGFRGGDGAGRACMRWWYISRCVHGRIISRWNACGTMHRAIIWM